MYELYYIIYGKIRSFNVIKGIKNLIKWFGIIWNDNDYEIDKLYSLLYFKLNNIQRYFMLEEKKDDYVEQIRECKNLIIRIKDKVIYDEYWNNECGFIIPVERVNMLSDIEKKILWDKMYRYLDGWEANN